MLTVDAATFASLRRLLCAANIEQRGVDDHGWLARDVLTLLGLQAPEQQQTSGAGCAKSGAKVDKGNPRPAPELPTTKGGDAMQPKDLFASLPKDQRVDIVNGRVGTDSPLDVTASRLTKGDEVRLRDAPAHAGSDVVVRVTYDGPRVLLRDTGWRWVKDVVRVEPEKAEKCPECGMRVACKLQCSRRTNPFPHDGGGERSGRVVITRTVAEPSEDSALRDEGPPRVGEDTCEHRDYTENDEDFPTGPECGKLATHKRCGPIVGELTCEDHACRCKIPLRRAGTGEKASGEDP